MLHAYVFMLDILQIAVWIVAWNSQRGSVWWICLKMRFSWKTTALNAPSICGFSWWLMALTCFDFVYLENYKNSRLLPQSDHNSLSFSNKHILIFLVWESYIQGFVGSAKHSRTHYEYIHDIDAMHSTHCLCALPVGTACLYNFDLTLAF